jgi:hypothetical protein
MGEKAYRQWWADDACPPRDPFLLEHSCTLADEGLWQEEKCVWRLLSFKGVGYQCIEHMDFLSILTVSSAAEGGELRLVINYDMKRKKI